MTGHDKSMNTLIEVFWVEKYLTFSQNTDNRLVNTDCLFLAEYALRGDAADSELFEAAVYRNDLTEPLAVYTGADALWCNQLWVNRKVRSFDSLAELEQAFPATDSFRWEVKGAVSGETRPIRIGGAKGQTDIPRPHAMRLYQDQVPVADYTTIDANRPLVVEWDPFPNGSSGPVVDDLVFFFVDDCRGAVVFFGGLPVDPDYITFRSTSVTIPAGTLHPGEPHTIFFSQCRMVDQDASAGLMNVAVNSFGVELDITTQGRPQRSPCPQPRLKAPFMWVRKARLEAGLETWPTLADGIHCAPAVMHNVKKLPK
jgi:hypothetical protein